jgi:hypothetical protein
MRFNPLFVLSLLLMAGLNCCSVSRAAEQASSYQPVTMVHFVRLEQAFAQFFHDPKPAALSDYYRHQTKRNGVGEYWRFNSKSELGWGRMKMNMAVDHSVFVQIPHRIYDLNTQTIAKHWFDSGKVKLQMSNSVHRNSGRDHEPSYNSDFSTAKNNPMVAASRSFVHHYRNPVVIQLHGFVAKKRLQQAAKDADIILSHGAILPSSYLGSLKQISACIEQQLGLNALIFGAQIGELGGTQNVVGAQLRKAGFFQGFYHLELSVATRKTLAKDAEKAQTLLACVIGGSG